MEPPIQYARTSDGVDIAYYAIGNGAPLIYPVPFSHLAHEWRQPDLRDWFERLAASRRLIRFDRRGVGLSDHGGTSPPDLAVRDIEAIARKEGLEQFALMGQAYSAAIAILYAAQHPDAVSHLLLWSPVARASDLHQSSPAFQAGQAAATKDWHTYTELFAQQTAGWSDADQARRFAAYLRDAGFTADDHERRFGHDDFDLTDELARLPMPVLIMHRHEAAFPAVEAVRRLATITPSARLILFEGSAIVPFFGDSEPVLRAINQFLAEEAAARPAGLTDRELEILALLAGGRSNAAIAEELSISARTAERHIGNIYRKIDVHNRAEATAYAFRAGIAPGSRAPT
jgi:pimeloyl-ACP methyl ester carboxylesterase